MMKHEIREPTPTGSIMRDALPDETIEDIIERFPYGSQVVCRANHMRCTVIRIFLDVNRGNIAGFGPDFEDIQWHNMQDGTYSITVFNVLFLTFLQSISSSG